MFALLFFCPRPKSPVCVSFTRYHHDRAQIAAVALISSVAAAYLICAAYSCVPIDPSAPTRFLIPPGASATTDDDDDDDDDGHEAQEQSAGAALGGRDSSLQSMSDTMRGGFEWLVESSDEEEGEAEFQRHIARVEAEAVVPPPTVTKQYLDASSRRRTLPSNTGGSGVANAGGGSSSSDGLNLNFSVGASTTGAMFSASSSGLGLGLSRNDEMSMSTGAGGVGSAGDPDQSLPPPPRAKRRWQRADTQIQGYFSSLMQSKNLSEPNVRVRRNISSREKRYEQRISRMAANSAATVRSAKQAAAAAVAAESAALSPGHVSGAAGIGMGTGGIGQQQPSYLPPRRMLAYENITRRVQQTLHDVKSLEEQRLMNEQAAAGEKLDGSGSEASEALPRRGAGAPVRMAPLRRVDKDPTVIGLRLPVGGGGGSGGGHDPLSASSGRGGRRRRRRQGRGRGRSGGEGGVAQSPLKYKEATAAAAVRAERQSLGLPQIM